MAKPSFSINFSQGLNTKIDPWQIPIGQFERLENSVFQIGGLLSKRPGYGKLPANSITNTFLTTLSDNLVSIGSTVGTYSQPLGEWITKGTLQPCALNVLPLIRNNLNQTKADCAVANGMVLTVYTENNSGSTQYRYAIADQVTGQNVVQPSAIPVISTGAITGSSRAFVVGPYFVIVSQVTASAVKYLQYVSIPVNNPVNLTTNAANVSVAVKVTSEVYSGISSNPGWDAVAVNDASTNALIVAYNSTTGAQGVHVAVLSLVQIATAQSTSIIRAFNNAAYIGALVSICVDMTVSPYVFYVTFWNNATTDGYTAALFINVGAGTTTVVFNPTKIISTVAVVNLASAAQSNSCLVFSETTNAYSYDSGVPSNFITGVTVSVAGVVGTPYVAIRSVGLASKACIINSTVYFLAAYTSPFQPTYFLINGSSSTAASPVIVAKLAYQNGGGYVVLGLSNAVVDGSVLMVPYLFKDDVEALTPANTSIQTSTGGVYSQTGINHASFTIGTDSIDAAEIASNLHISGGYLSQFDGFLPVEHNFFLFPDSVECTWSATGGSIHAQPDGSTNTSAYYYMVTYEWTDNAGLAYRSTPSIPVAVTTTSNGTAGSITVNVPYIRLTAKVTNKVKIVIYRWSVAQQTYFQTTSITVPTLNDTTADSVAYVDTLADASISGNNILYTTGGIPGDFNAPACNGLMGLFNSSLVMIDAENPNNALISKTVLPNTPVEMSKNFSIFISPTQGVQKSMGPVTACSPMDDKFIFFFAQGASYVNGSPPDALGTTANGCSLGGYSQPTAIASSVGCTNQKSIVMTSSGLMFQSDKGIWLLDRFKLQTSYIGAPVERYNSSTVTSAVVVPQTTYVLFTLDTGEILMYDYFYNQWGTFVGVRGASSCIHSSRHIILDQYGNILQETPGEYLDNANPVLMGLATGWINVAGVQGFERFFGFYLLGRYLSPHFIDIGIAYNYNPSLRTRPVVSPNNFSSAAPSPFGDQSAPFGSPVDLEQWLIHSQYQKCQSFQISAQEIFNPLLGTVAGPGFTLSGFNILTTVKRGSRPIAQNVTTG